MAIEEYSPTSSGVLSGLSKYDLFILKTGCKDWAIEDYGFHSEWGAFVDELYDGSRGEGDTSGNPTPSMVATALDDGRSVVNYAGHGGPTGWSTSGFGNSDINTLVNDNMLPYVICVACNNGQFDDYDACFCEAWLRATNNGEPTGAIAATGSSKSSSLN